MSVGRGAVLIAAAFIIGLILLQKTDRAPRSVRTQGGVTPTTLPSLTLPTTGSTIQTGHQAKDVKVLVANGTNTPGAASRVVQTLTTSGYNVLAPTDATKAAKTTTRASVVYFTPGYDQDARVIAVRAGLQQTAVLALPATPPVASTQGANVVVLIGPDLAGSGGTTATTSRTATTARTATTSRSPTTVHTATTSRSPTTIHTTTTVK
jgi:hypothetical protein